MSANPRLHERNPFHEAYRKNRDMQSRIIFAKLRHEKLNGKLPNLEQKVLMESAAVLIIELHQMTQKFFGEVRTRPPKQFYQVLTQLRNTLNQITPKPRAKKSNAGGENDLLDLGSIVNG